MSQTDSPSDSQNPYLPPNLPSVAPAVVTTEDSEAEQLRAFVGSKAQYYLDMWTPVLRGWSGGTGFNWGAFFFSGLWLPYRKMYTAAFILWGIILVESILEELLFVGILVKQETPPGFDRIVGLVVGVVCGAYGNRWYLSHARRIISDIRSQGLPQDAVLRTIAERGGTNLPAAFGILLLYIAAIFVVFFVLEFFAKSHII